MEQIRQITFNIYASTDEEAARGRKAIVDFINIVGQHGGKVSGDKIVEAMGKLNSSPFIASQIINFFR